MDYRDDRRGSKFIFLAIIIVVLYLAFFNFDVRAAYDYTVFQIGSMFSL